jgi:DNA-binding NarL/FixJ family response regulator
MMRILVVDDHPMMRFGLITIIDGQPNMKVVAEAGTGLEAIERFTQFHPDLTLMDLQLPGMSGVNAIRAIRDRQQDARIVVLTTYRGDEDIHQAIQAGAAGYLIKGMSHERLIEALRAVASGRTYLPSEVTSQLRSRVHGAGLSAREHEVLSLIAKGKSNKAIAAQLGVAESTGKCHVTVILERLQADDRTHAVVVALHRGLIHLDDEDRSGRATSKRPGRE